MRGQKIRGSGSGRGPRAALCRQRGMCYNQRAVERAAQQRFSPEETAPGAQGSGGTARKETGEAAKSSEDASRYCPVCSQRLESRRCKLICAMCGYYMSCADYY